MSILVAGSTHLDIIARATGNDAFLEKVGNVTISAGGTAFNIAATLHHLGARVRLMTAMNGYPQGRIITDSLRALGIDTRIDIDPSLPTAVFHAHMNRLGDICSAISSLPVDQHHFGPSRIAEALDGVTAAVLDTTLSADTLESIVDQATTRRIPVFAVSVSEEKSVRVSRVTQLLAGLFLRSNEYRYLLGHLTASAAKPDQAAHELGCPIMLSCGSERVRLYTPTSEDWIDASDPGQRLSVKHGVEDTLAAGTIFHHVVNALPLHEALKRALDLVTRQSAQAELDTPQPPRNATFQEGTVRHAA